MIVGRSVDIKTTVMHDFLLCDGCMEVQDTSGLSAVQLKALGWFKINNGQKPDYDFGPICRAKALKGIGIK